MLQYLYLHRNPISEGGAVEVLRSLHHYKTPLKTLNLQDTGIGEQDSVPLVQLIGDNVLENLLISGDLLPSIMKCPLPNSTLQTLNMSATPLSEEATMSLSSLLQQSVLQFSKWNIGWCGVTSDGAVQLARALTNNSWLTELDMSGNSIGEEGAKALANMLKENRTLKELDLSGDKTLGEGVDVLISSLQENKTLQRLRILTWVQCAHMYYEVWVDMVVYTGGNACSLLSDLISIQGLIQPFFFFFTSYTCTGAEKKFLMGMKNLKSKNISLYCISHFGERLAFKGKIPGPPPSSVSTPNLNCIVLVWWWYTILCIADPVLCTASNHQHTSLFTTQHK